MSKAIEATTKKLRGPDKVKTEREEAKKFKKAVLKNLDGRAVQLCLEAYRMPDVLAVIPNDVRIERIELGHTQKIQDIRIDDTHMDGFSRFYHRMKPQQSRFQMVFMEAHKDHIEEWIRIAGEKYKFAAKDVHVTELRVSKDGATLVFALQLKGIPEAGDARKCTRVLGLTKINRDPEMENMAKKLLSRFSLAKFVCRYKTIEQKIALCSKEAAE